MRTRRAPIKIRREKFEFCHARRRRDNRAYITHLIIVVTLLNRKICPSRKHTHVSVVLIVDDMPKMFRAEIVKRFRITRFWKSNTSHTWYGREVKTWRIRSNVGTEFAVVDEVFIKIGPVVDET